MTDRFAHTGWLSRHQTTLPLDAAVVLHSSSATAASSGTGADAGSHREQKDGAGSGVRSRAGRGT